MIYCPDAIEASYFENQENNIAQLAENTKYCLDIHIRYSYTSPPERGIPANCLNFPEMRRDDPVKFTDSDHARRLLNNLIGKVAGKNTCRQSRNHRYKATKNTAHYCMKEVPIYIRRGDREKIFARILHRSFIPINIKLRGEK